MSQKTSLELQQSLNGAFLTGTTILPSSTKKSRGRVQFAPGLERSPHNTRRSRKLFPAKLRLEVSETGTASVVDGRRRCLIGRQPDKERPHYSGIHYLECISRARLARKLRRLASSLEKEPDPALKALLREIQVSVGALLDCVKRVEQTALTRGFYGQPPRITIK